MEEGYIPISTLNDFYFCPYSIFLHNVYMETDESFYHAAPQVRGRLAHEAVDSKKASNRKDELQALPVISEAYMLVGKIDIYKGLEKKLIERKYQLKSIYQGQVYQLWAQYLCMVEMGYDVDAIAFYDMCSNKMIPVDIPSEIQLSQFRAFIRAYRDYDPSAPLAVNRNKCAHCIYCSLCDKTYEENVYQ